MSSSSEKGKSGGKKLSADKQLLALQDALTSGGLRTAVSSLEIGGSLDNNVNGDEPGEEGGEGSLCESEGRGRHS